MQSVLSKRRRVGTTLVAVTLALAGLAGCSSEEPEPQGLDQVTVSGAFGQEPTLEYQTPVEVDEPVFEVIWAGEGPVSRPGGTVLLNILGQDAASGTQILDTFVDLPQIFEVNPESLGDVLFNAISGQRAGARILVLDPDDRQGREDVPIVLVLDVLAGQAAGEPVEPEDGLPQVELAETGVPTVTIDKKLRGKPPTEMHVQPLIRGSGAPVKSGQTVFVQYTAVTWSDGLVIDSTWDAGRSPFMTIVGDSRPIEAWDDALIEQPVGSQILLVAPSSVAYGGSADAWADETIVFVIDILFAGTLAAPDATPDGSDDEQSAETAKKPKE